VTILLGFVVIALATYQVQVVPDQNARVEFSHSQTVQGELQDVRGAIVSVPGGGNGRSVSVQLGTTYPSRTIFLNPPPPTGQLRTANEGQLRIDNATADGEVGDFWDGSERNVTTTTLEYRPNYNVYQNGPTTVIDNTVVYDVQPRSGDRVIDTDQRLIDGDRINLVAVRGDYQRASGRSVAVDVRGVSSSTRTVAVTGGGDPITITVPTQLSASEWNSSELLGSEPNVRSVTPVTGADAVRVELDGSETYELRMAKAGLTNGVTRPGPAYVTDVEGDGATVQTGGSQRLVAEVRDEYNNPVSGVTVNVSSVEGGSVDETSGTTDADGRATFTYTPDTVGSNDIVVNISGTPTASEEVIFTVDAGSGSGNGSGGDGAYTVSWKDPSGKSQTVEPCSADSCTLDASDARLLDLSVGTEPDATGATVEYALNNSSVGSLSPTVGTTDTAGENTTTFEARANGTVLLYVSSGGSGDRFRLDVTNVSFTTVAYIDPDTDNLNTIDSDGSVTTYLSGSTEDVRAIGPSRFDFDGDGRDEVPYVNNARDLKIVDETGETQTLVGPSDPEDAVYSDATVGAGDGDGDGTVEVYFTENSNSELFQVELGGEPEVLKTPSSSNQDCSNINENNPRTVSAQYGAAGVADYDGDGSPDIVFVNENDKVAYYNSENCQAEEAGGPNVESGNGGVGIGEPFIYQGTAQVPVVDGDSDLVLVASDGTETQVSTGPALATSPLAPRDWDGDGTTEVVNLDGSGSPYELQYAEIGTGTLVEIENDGGTSENGDRQSGAR